MNKISSQKVIFLLILLGFCISLPSILIHYYYVECSSCVSFNQNTILFDEKFWIYLLEFKRQLTLGFFNWPSDNVDFSSIFYIERILPRLLYYPLSNFENYFLYDSIIIFLSFIISTLVIIKILKKQDISPIVIILTLGFFSIYNFRILFLEETIPELWFSRNPVAIISLMFSIIIMFYSNVSQKKQTIVKSLGLFALMLTHTYSFMLMFGYIILKLIFKLFKNKKIDFLFFPFLFIIFILFLLSYLNLTSSDGFINFQKYYGAIESYSPNWNEVLKILILLIPCFVFRKNKLVVNCIILLISVLILTNIQLITGSLLRDIHYRIYTLEWIVSLIIISGTFKLLLKNKILKINLLSYSIAFISLLYIIIYSNNFSYNCIECKTIGNCDNESNMKAEIFHSNLIEILNCKRFIWDAPNYKKNLNSYKNCKSIHCKSWRDATIHLHSSE